MTKGSRTVGLRWLALAMAGLAVLLQLRLWTGDGGYGEVRSLEAAVAAQRAENEALRERNARLAADVSDLKQGREAIEERARSELGMVRPGEVFYQVVEPAAAPPRGN